MMCIMPGGILGGAVQDPLDRANRYREKAMECGELAKYARFAFRVDG
jgi:hypothetical protein